MFSILSITLPIFLLIGAGLIAGRFMGLKQKDLRGLIVFVWYFALPALVIRAFLQHSLTDFVHPAYVEVYVLASITSFAANFSVSRWLRNKSLSESAMHGLGAANSNSGFIGLPIATLVTGPYAAIGLTLNMMIENTVIIPTGLVLAAEGRRGAQGAIRMLKESVRALLTNPLFLSVLIGIALSLTGIDFTGLSVFRTVDMLANASASVALFVVGVTLSETKVRGLLGDAAQVSFGKLVVHPLAVVLFAMTVPDLEPEMRRTAIIFASAPMLTIYPIIAHRFGMQETASAALVMATSCSFITISIALALI